MLDVNRLRVFRAVVANGSVHAAAAQLGYTPSTISQHITSLQRETGLTLFEKAGRGIEPTATGRLLAAESDEVMAGLARLGGMVEDIRNGRTGRLEIAAFSSAAQVWVPTVVGRLRDEHPGIVVDLALNEIFEDPTTSTADIDVRTEQVGEETTRLAGHTRHVLNEVEGYVLVVPAGHPLADARDPVSLADVATDPWVRDGRSSSLCTTIVRRAAAAVGVTPNYVAHADDHHTALAFVVSGVGVLVLPRLAARAAPTGTVVLDLGEPRPSRRVVAFVRDTTETSPVVMRAVELLTEEALATAGHPAGPAQGASSAPATS